MTFKTVWNGFSDPAKLAAALADQVAHILREAIETRGKALLAVSGGTTPARFFQTLSQKDLDWAKVTIAPVDERFVPPSSDRSNEGLIRANLMQGKARKASFLPLWTDQKELSTVAETADHAITALGAPFDVIVLGMGEDAHTASFFPDSPELAATLDLQNPHHVVAIHSVNAKEPRLTLTLRNVLAAPFIALHIEGQEKRDVLERAIEQPDPLLHPISAVLANATAPVQIYWAPKAG